MDNVIHPIIFLSVTMMEETVLAQLQALVLLQSQVLLQALVPPLALALSTRVLLLIILVIMYIRVHYTKVYLNNGRWRHLNLIYVQIIF